MIVANPASAQSPTRPGLARHLTGVGEWLRIGEAAILAADARDEWIEGEIIDRPAIGPAHAGEAHRSTAIPCEAVHDRAGGSERNSIPLGHFSAPRPDVAVSRYRDDDYEPSPPAAPGVLSLIEVADIQLVTTAAASVGVQNPPRECRAVGRQSRDDLARLRANSFNARRRHSTLG